MTKKLYIYSPSEEEKKEMNDIIILILKIFLDRKKGLYFTTATIIKLIEQYEVLFNIDVTEYIIKKKK